MTQAKVGRIPVDPEFAEWTTEEVLAELEVLTSDLDTIERSREEAYRRRRRLILAARTVTPSREKATTFKVLAEACGITDAAVSDAIDKGVGEAMAAAKRARSKSAVG